MRSKKLFISSTIEDLKEHRAAAFRAAKLAGFEPDMTEYWAAEGRRPPLEECLLRIEKCSVLIVLVAHRFGWIPDGPKNPDRKSITWLECEHAKKHDVEVIPFLLDDKAEWPLNLREEHAYTKLGLENKLTPDRIAEIQHALTMLPRFKGWLNGLGIRALFQAHSSTVGEAVACALAGKIADAPGDPSKHLREIFKRTAHLDIRGIAVGTTKAHRFEIDALYIPLSIPLRHEPKSGENPREEQPKSEPLHRALRFRRVVILGGPGSGKSTFLRFAAHVLADTALGLDPTAAKTKLGLETRVPLPFFVSLASLANFRADLRDSPQRLIQFLADQAEANACQLSAEFLRRKFEEGEVIAFLDGLDEAPNRSARETLARLIENTARSYERAQFVVTSRPNTYRDRAMLDEFERVEIEPLDAKEVERFLTQWSSALHGSDESQATAHRDDLLAAIRSRSDIQDVVRNPLMLTALAVVHWNERRIPEQRAALYESIVTWLARSREEKPGRAKPEDALRILQELALALQLAPGGRQIELTLRAAAEAIESRFPGADATARLTAANDFLTAEEIDSGILVEREGKLRFWHLTFQEFLAARAIAARPDGEQHEILLGSALLALEPEWRETARLFVGISHVHGPPKVSAFLGGLLDRVDTNPTVRLRARALAYLEGALADLRSLGFRFEDTRYGELPKQVLGIFERGSGIPMQERIDAAEALGRVGDPRFLSPENERFATIPGGTCRDKTFESFQIGRYPVTVGEYAAFVAATGQEPPQWSWLRQHPTRPIVNVTFDDAKQYCDWLGGGARLPTEAEWEWAAAGAMVRKYPWGSDEPTRKLANFGHYVGSPTPVGVYPDSQTPDTGLQDLAGNVWEWCEDLYDPKAKDKSVPGGARVVRGGCYWDGPDWLRCAARYWWLPWFRVGGLGFRVVRPASPEL